MKKTLFINYCAYIPGEKAIKRTFYLFQMMLDQGYDVTFLTSDFNHYEKKERDIAEFYKQYPTYQDCVKFVHMKGYSKNISLKRFANNINCEKNILNWFKNNGSNFDIVYISWPTYGLINKIRKYCDEFKSKLIIDVNDLWPGSLRVVFKNDAIYNMLTAQMQKKANQAFSYADGLVAVSEEYLELASCVNTRATERMAVYIGSMIKQFDNGVTAHQESIVKNSDEFWITYIGTLGTSYDIDTVIKAVASLRKEHGINIRFKILGQGPTEGSLKALTNQLNCDGIDFVGFQEYGVMASYLSRSDICVNCIKARASQSIINKAADYFSSGKPILNCGSCQEMKELVSKYDAGINYEAENVESLKKSILELINNKEEAIVKGRNARRLAEEKFDRDKTHQLIIEMIERL